MEIPLSEEIEYKQLRLTVIIELLTSSDDEEVIRRLWTELYERISENFFDRCHKIVQRRYGNAPDWEATRDDMFQETFITAFEEIKEFKLKAHWGDEECEKVVLFWLGQITNNKLLRLIKVEDKENQNLEKYKYHLLSENSPEAIGKRKYEPTYDKAKFDIVWNKLNLMSKEILDACWYFETLSEDNVKHLPDSVIAALMKKYNVKEAAIRKAKSRSIKAIKSCKIEK